LRASEIIETNVKGKAVREHVCGVIKTDGYDAIYSITRAQEILINEKGTQCI